MFTGVGQNNRNNLKHNEIQQDHIVSKITPDLTHRISVIYAKHSHYGIYKLVLGCKVTLALDYWKHFGGYWQIHLLFSLKADVLFCKKISFS